MRTYDVYSWFWDDPYGVNFQRVRKINIEELWFRSHLLLLNKNKEKAREEYAKWLKQKILLTNKKQFAETLLKITDSNLPRYSIYIQIRFTLKKPYLSKDDDDFYIIDNPIVKDKVFKLPMVRATTWKGALRFAAIKEFENWVYEKLTESKIDKEEVFRERVRIVKLFGTEKDSQEDYLGRLCLMAIEGSLPAGIELKKKVSKINEEFERWLVANNIISKEVPSRSGRLFFYPTFFDEISLDVITPLSRETRTPVKGRGPIYFETVPEKSKGMFRLLYYPFDLVARGEFDKIEKEMEEDLKFLSRALHKMFYEIGFSAKKTSGFGVISEFDGKVMVPFKDVNSKFKSFDELDLSKLCAKVNKNVDGGASG